MAGKLLQVLPKRKYDFSTLNVGATQTIVVVDRIDISQSTNAVLAVRTNSGTFGGLNTILLELYGDGYTSDDPSVVFRTAGTFRHQGNVFQVGGLATYGGTVRGHYAALILTATHGSAGAFNITLSADLILRAPDYIA